MIVFHGLSTNLGSPALLYIGQEASLLVSYNVRVLVGLQGSNVTRITCGKFLVRLDLLPSLRGTRGLCPTASTCGSYTMYSSPPPNKEHIV
jgi:hypothetical protein